MIGAHVWREAHGDVSLADVQIIEDADDFLIAQHIREADELSGWPTHCCHIISSVLKKKSTDFMISKEFSRKFTSPVPCSAFLRGYST